MESYKFGEVIIVPYTYTDLQSGKRRPALVLVDTGDEDILVAKITRKKYESRCDLVLEKWMDAGLLAPSITRLHKLLSIEKTLVLQRAGSLVESDLERVRKVIQNLV